MMSKNSKLWRVAALFLVAALALSQNPIRTGGGGGTGGGGSYSAGTGLLLSSTTFSVNSAIALFVDDYQDGKADFSDTTTANAMTACSNLAMAGAYQDGMLVKLRVKDATTANTTLNWCGGGVKNIYKADRTTRVGNGDWADESLHVLLYDSSVNAAAGGFVEFSGAGGSSGSITAPYVDIGGTKGLIRGVTIPFVDSGYTARNGVTATMSSSVLVLTSDSVADTINHYMKTVGSETEATVLCEMHFVQSANIQKPLFCGVALRRSGGPQVGLVGYGYQQYFGIGNFGVWTRSATADGDTPAWEPAVVSYWPPCGTPYIRVNWSDSTNITVKASCDGVHFIDVVTHTRSNFLGSTSAPTEMGVGIIASSASQKGYVYHLQYQ